MNQSLHKLFLLLILICSRSALSSDIIHGKKAKQKSMMYMASVQNDNGHACGGFVISEDFVVTAAHCFDGNLKSVVVGTHNLKAVNNGTMRYYIKQMCKHPSYKDPASGNDIMLLKLSTEINFGRKALVKSIKLPKTDMKLKDNKKCRVGGWGYTRTKGGRVDDLMEVEVPIINPIKCQKEWSNNLPAKIICAGGFGTKKGFCQGDSGGPLVCSGKAVGVVSFNDDYNCNYPNLPNIYTDISKYVIWIQKILKTKTCKK